MLPIAKLITLLIRDRIANLTAKELNKNKIGVRSKICSNIQQTATIHAHHSGNWNWCTIA